MTWARLTALALTSTFLSGCELYSVVAYHDPTPAIPTSVSSITADGAIYLNWEDGSAVPVAAYRIYRGEGSAEQLYFLASCPEPGFVDYDVSNGITYYYGVTTVSPDGHESGLSRIVNDTPRPEGYDLVLFDAGLRADRSGFDFDSQIRTSLDDPRTDVLTEIDPATGLLVLWAMPGTDLQDMGFTETLDDITYSPTDGWSPDGSAVVIYGHTYVVWTENNHFAKLRAVEVATTWARLDWAYQVDPGNPELVKPAHGSDYGRRLQAPQSITAAPALSQAR